jgi:subtilisin family serine protease
MSSPAFASSPGTGLAPSRYLVTFADGEINEGIQFLERKAELKNVTDESVAAQQPASAVILARLGIAIVLPSLSSSAEMEKLCRQHRSDLPIAAVERDQAVRAIPEPLKPLQEKDARNEAVQESTVTWGLKATRVDRSNFTGKGVRVAVLDSGLHRGHPDFSARQLDIESFVGSHSAEDCLGHGTHCIGTACGPKESLANLRYGIACGCDLFVGKVLDDSGQGFDSTVLTGMEWSLKNRCVIVSMSFGRETFENSYSVAFENAARRALELGSVLVAAAGNDSNRKGGYRPERVLHPANCPSVLAVGAVAPQLNLASFSNGGCVGIVAPGVSIYSSHLHPANYRRLTGTSMATAHVAGIAALHAEKSGLRGNQLRSLLGTTARPLPLPVADGGAGLIQAP